MVSRNFTKTGFLAAGVAVVAALSGCVMDAPTRGRVVTAPTGIEGNWRNSQGLYTASFANSSTTWNDSQTGATLIRGTYSRVSQNDYALTLTSASSGQQRQANCRVVGGSQLNCVYASGDQFQMYRS